MPLTGWALLAAALVLLFIVKRVEAITSGPASRLVCVALRLVMAASAIGGCYVFIQPILATGRQELIAITAIPALVGIYQLTRI